MFPDLWPVLVHNQITPTPDDFHLFPRNWVNGKARQFKEHSRGIVRLDTDSNCYVLSNGWIVPQALLTPRLAFHLEGLTGSQGTQ